MPWKHVTPMSQRKEFVSLAMVDGVNISQLCRRFEISRKTGYKWLARVRAEGETGLADRSRRPRRSPRTTPRGPRQAGPRLDEGSRGQHHHRHFAPPWVD